MRDSKPQTKKNKQTIQTKKKNQKTNRRNEQPRQTETKPMPNRNEGAKQVHGRNIVEKEIIIKGEKQNQNSVNDERSNLGVVLHLPGNSSSHSNPGLRLYSSGGRGGSLWLCVWWFEVGLVSVCRRFEGAGSKGGGVKGGGAQSGPIGEYQ